METIHFCGTEKSENRFVVLVGTSKSRILGNLGAYTKKSFSNSVDWISVLVPYTPKS